MKILAMEYACAGGPGGKPFLEEGRAMLGALLKNLIASGEGEIITLIDPSLSTGKLKADSVVEAVGDFFVNAAEQIEAANAVWIIAPESGGILGRITSMAERLGKIVIGCGSKTIATCSNKFLLAKSLSGTIPMPETKLLADSGATFPSVVKPLQGAGCEGVRYAKSREEVAGLPGNEFIIQPYIEGDTLSASVIIDNNLPLLLGVCRQHIDIKNIVLPLKIEGPIKYRHEKLLVNMIKEILRLIPDLKGYWGIDFIDNEGKLTLIEINPRLTTSYPIYKNSVSFNIAQVILKETFGQTSE